MVCIYCGSSTQVTNSRTGARNNSVWRRRRCTHCTSVVTTREEVVKESVLRIKRLDRLEAFSRDKLFLSVHDSLRHRKTVVEDANALTATIITKLGSHNTDGVIDVMELKDTTHSILARFDKLAATYYQAHHVD